MPQAVSTRRGPGWLVPSTLPGRWSAGLLAASLLCFVFFFVLVMSGQRGGDTFFSNLWLSGTILPAAALAIAAGAVGLAAAIRDGERSLVVGIAIIYGFLVLMFTVGEVAFPH